MQHSNIKSAWVCGEKKTVTGSELICRRFFLLALGGLGVVFLELRRLKTFVLSK
jgi:hypothetical protein